MKKIALTLLFTFSAQAIADDEAFTLQQCITKHQAMSDLIFEIAERDMKVLTAYSHYEVAQRDIRRWKTLAIENPDDADISEAMTELVAKQDESLDEAVSQMYGRRLKTNRLRNLRNEVNACYGMKFEQDTITEVCSTEQYGGTLWCKGRF